MSFRTDSYATKRSAGKPSKRSSRKQSKSTSLGKSSGRPAQVRGNAKGANVIAYPSDELVQETLEQLVACYKDAGQQEVLASLVADLSNEAVRLIVENDGPKIEALHQVRDPYSLIRKALKLKRRLDYEAAKREKTQRSIRQVHRAAVGH